MGGSWRRVARQLHAVKGAHDVMNRPGLPECRLVESSSYGQTALFIILLFLKLARRDIPDRHEQPLYIEPEYPLKRSELDGLPIPPGSPAPDGFRLEETVNRLCQSIVIGTETFGLRASRRGQRQYLPISENSYIIL